MAESRQTGGDSESVERPNRGEAASSCRALRDSSSCHTQSRRKLLMPHATATDGVRLYFEEVGAGTPLLFLHEFAADHSNWEPQLRYFARRHRSEEHTSELQSPDHLVCR